MFGIGKKKPPEQPSTHIYQEFYCTRSGGGCGGYVIVKLRTTFQGQVEFTCPNCNHKHRRTVKNGRIVEEGRFSKDADIELFPTMAAYSKTPRHIANDPTRSDVSERDARVFSAKNDVRDPALAELWFDYHGGS